MRYCQESDILVERGPSHLSLRPAIPSRAHSSIPQHPNHRHRYPIPRTFRCPCCPLREPYASYDHCYSLRPHLLWKQISGSSSTMVPWPPPLDPHSKLVHELRPLPSHPSVRDVPISISITDTHTHTHTPASPTGPNTVQKPGGSVLPPLPLPTDKDWDLAYPAHTTPGVHQHIASSRSNTRLRVRCAGNCVVPFGNSSDLTGVACWIFVPYDAFRWRGCQSPLTRCLRHRSFPFS